MKNWREIVLNTLLAIWCLEVLVCLVLWGLTQIEIVKINAGM